MKILPIIAAIGAVASLPAHAQDAVDTAEDAMEHAAEAVEAAASETVSIQVEGQSSPPQLLEFDLLQAKPGDYPPLSWVNDEAGTAYYELAVDAQGAVTDCAIIETTGHETLDAKTCEIAMERGEFTAALDESGSPVAGTHRDFQVWTKREPQFPGTSIIHVQYTATADGGIADCEVIEITGYIGERMRRTMENEPCPGMNRPAQPPYRDEDGNPVSTRVDLTILVETQPISE
jgi:hypothetical protein